MTRFVDRADAGRQLARLVATRTVGVAGTDAEVLDELAAAARRSDDD
ncbi:MAG: hypothetical protein QNM02_11000 [Acidimicrobiia bacterium]|nr:hypothetical protein [Acidimicrobiia bacterium]